MRPTENKVERMPSSIGRKIDKLIHVYRPIGSY